MSEETTQATPPAAEQVEHNPSTILCRIVDVNTAIQNSFQRFFQSEGKTLEELASLMREEMSQIELFVPATEPSPQNQ
jgi:hypothetical protein